MLPLDRTLFYGKSDAEAGGKWYLRGLEAPGHTEDEYQALRYELGLAYEQAGEADKALELFSDIYAVNVTYRNIGDKVRSLQTA